MSTGAQPGKLSNVPYETLEVGRRFGPYLESVDAALADSLRVEVGSPTPGSVAPPAVFPILFLRALRRSMGGIPAGSILAGQEVYLEKPLPVDGEVSIETWVADKTEKKTRRFVVIEFEIRDGEGDLVGGGTKTIIWPRGAEGGGDG